MDNPIWSQIIDSTHLTVDRSAVFQKLREHLTLLHSVNNQMNLTRIDDPAQAELLHVADSLTLLPFLPLPLGGEGRGEGAEPEPQVAAASQASSPPSSRFESPAGQGRGEGEASRVQAGKPGKLVENKSQPLQGSSRHPSPQPSPLEGRGSMRLADVGSGGGFPGIPIAIVRPDIRVTLIEATHKKAEFLKHVATRLQLGNVTVIADRSENLRGHQWDIVVTRALAAMDKLVTLCLPLVKPGGKLLAMKGPRGREELPAAAKSIRRFRGEEPVIHPANLPGRDHIIIEIQRRG